MTAVWHEQTRHTSTTSAPPPSPPQQQHNLERLRFNRRGAPTPLWGVESCSHPSRWSNPIPAIPSYVVKTPHLHGAPTTEETSRHSSSGSWKANRWEPFSKQIVEQIVQIPVSGGVIKGFRPGQSSSLKIRMGLGKVFFFFAPFPKIKKCGVRTLPESEGARQCQLIHAGSSAPYPSLGVGHDPHL